MIDEDDGFEEILEIFVEEVSDVVDIIDSNLQQLENDPAADKPLKELRRAFHTLKGSSRMVNANAIGDLGWVMEDLLNRIVDGVVEVNKDLVALTIDVRDAIPRLLSAFKKRQAAAMSGVNIPSFADRANAIIAGEVTHAVNPALMDVAANIENIPVSKGESEFALSTLDRADLENLKASNEDFKQAIADLKEASVNAQVNSESLSTQIAELSSYKSISLDVKSKFTQLDKLTQDIADMQYLIKSTFDQTAIEGKAQQQRIAEALKISEDTFAAKFNEQEVLIKTLKHSMKLGFLLSALVLTTLIAVFISLQ